MTRDLTVTDPDMPFARGVELALCDDERHPGVWVTLLGEDDAELAAGLVLPAALPALVEELTRLHDLLAERDQNRAAPFRSVRAPALH